MNHRLTLGDSDYTEGQKQEGFTADGVDFAGTEDHSVLGGFETRPTVRCCINSMMQERIALLSRLITPREGGRGTEAIKRILVGAAMVLATAGGVAVGQIQWEPHTIAGGEFSAIDALVFLPSIWMVMGTPIYSLRHLTITKSPGMKMTDQKIF